MLRIVQTFLSATAPWSAITSSRKVCDSPVKVGLETQSIECYPIVLKEALIVRYKARAMSQGDKRMSEISRVSRLGRESVAHANIGKLVLNGNRRTTLIEPGHRHRKRRALSQAQPSRPEQL
jgi:hypothetical protein